jgi:prophage antirepressor-like protein
MKKEVQVFESLDFSSIRVVWVGEQCWFVGTDVAKALGYIDCFDALKIHVDEEDKMITQLSDYQFPGETPENSVSSSYDENTDSQNNTKVATLSRGYSNRRIKSTLIIESGLYSLILRSNLPSAIKFKRWVTHEVLPSIRKYGEYKLFRKDDKALQRSGMTELLRLLPNAASEDYMKVNIMLDKAVSTFYGFEKMLKKEEMSEEMLQDRQAILNMVSLMYSFKEREGTFTKEQIYDEAMRVLQGMKDRKEAKTLKEKEKLEKPKEDAARC